MGPDSSRNSPVKISTTIRWMDGWDYESLMGGELKEEADVWVTLEGCVPTSPLHCCQQLCVCVWHFPQEEQECVECPLPRTHTHTHTHFPLQWQTVLRNEIALKLPLYYSLIPGMHSNQHWGEWKQRFCGFSLQWCTDRERRASFPQEIPSMVPGSFNVSQHLLANVANVN